MRKTKLLNYEYFYNEIGEELEEILAEIIFNYLENIYICKEEI